MNTCVPVVEANPLVSDTRALVALFTSGRYAEAVTLAAPLTQRFPHHEFAWKMLAAALSRLGCHADALEPMQKAVALSPDDAEAHSNLGATFKALGHLQEAQASYQRALQIKPDYVQAHYNLGNTLQALGQLEQAEMSYRNALQLAQDFAPAHFNLGNALKTQGRLDDAERSYLNAVRIKPDHAQAWCNLGATLQALGRLHDAEASYRRALHVQPDYADAYSNLGNTLGDLGKMDAAQASYQRALRIKPDHTEAFSNLLFALNYHPDKSAQEIFAAYNGFEQRFGQPHRGAWPAHSNPRTPQRRLKVGYVSPALRQHSSRHFLEPLLAQHDHSVVEVYAYAELAREDAVTARYKGYVDHWVPTRGMSDDALAQRIRDDGIDILVDVAGHTAGNRLQVFARKPAPVSLHWLDFGYTTGLSAIDYYLTDWPTVPAGSEALFSETPWRLDGPGLVYRPAESMGKAGPLPAAGQGFVTFGSLTRAVRINHHTVRIWAELLKRVPKARLVINSGDYRTAAMQDELAKRFAAHGITRERLDIGHHSPPWDVLRQIDIGLDCFPHNSGTTLFESLYLGVPFVTLAGRPSVGTLGSAILHGLGHPEWIADSEAQYVAIAVTLAADLPKLAATRAGLRAEMQASPLMDEAGFARRVEAAYRGMFKAWSES
ncbi:MAG: tetratricopeptide repeat protein [Rhodoferax sp.]|nr:tetratricopeptide repeat protein [Rhodoferax sp.]